MTDRAQAMPDPYDLQRFVNAQNQIFEQVCSELRKGRKQTHWMWFVFPQLRGLGHSLTAQKFGISSRAEAEAYVRHPVLGARLRQCTQIVNAVADSSIEQIFGYPDYLKFRSSMTLFAETASDREPFACALRKYFGGEPDPLTLQQL